MKKYILALFVSIIVVLFWFMCVWLISETIERANKPNTYVEQTYVDNMLRTSAVFNGENIWYNFDVINLQSNDSIKLIRYQEAEMWIDKFEKIEKVNKK